MSFKQEQENLKTTNYCTCTMYLLQLHLKITRGTVGQDDMIVQICYEIWGN